LLWLLLLLGNALSLPCQILSVSEGFVRQLCQVVGTSITALARLER
jgi:hypothetical protein